MEFEQAWLTYSGKFTCKGADEIKAIRVRIPEDRQDVLIKNSVAELQSAFAGLLGRELSVHMGTEDGDGICLALREGMQAEAYHLYEDGGKITVEASDSHGILYGVFALLRKMRTEDSLQGVDLSKAPAMPMRMLDHWDNMDGSIERGYSGRSFFFRDDEILVNERSVTYARLAASVGINAAVINNVNVKDAATWLITERYADKVKELSEVFAGYGIKLYLSLNYAAPMEVGGLVSADPLSEEARLVEGEDGVPVSEGS